MLPEPDALVEDAGLYEPLEPTTELIPATTLTADGADVR